MSELGKPCRVTATRREFQSVAQVYEALRSASGDSWLQTTSAVWRRLGTGEWQRLSGLEASWEELPPLDGEFVLSGTTSASLRHMGQTWLWIEIGEGDSAGDESRRLDHVQIGIDGRDLKQAVYWHQVQEGSGEHSIQVWRPWVARFVGFGSESSRGGQ